MRIGRILALCSALAALLPAGAAAQEQHKVGIVMGYPASLGVLWHASDKIAVRPELTLSGSSTETSSSSLDIEGDGWNLGTGVSALFYLRTEDRLKTYFSPRFTYTHASSTSSASGVTTSELKQTTNTVGVSGSFGAQYAVGDRFTVFGELGFAFSHLHSKSSLAPSSGSGNGWGLHSGVGIVFYP